ncbi:HNH endonuclease signature motif containing protein [Sporosarcina sp. NCCP-2331]|uniref:HNH endonuclease n=2 Tax=unclassified Sporosarcina TaxID=2647733 RepID=UPI00283AAD77|nr:HNH endonuclease signature motif containing protein [Sporosarcina sp. NCCP-2331]
MRQCRHPSCRVLIPFTDTYCERHIRTVNQSYDKAKQRSNPVYAAFYQTTAWRNTRKVALMRDDWLCQHCLNKGKHKTAEMVDHIIPTLVDWEKRLELDNLQSLCNACHNKKTAKDVSKYRKSPPGAF